MEDADVSGAVTRSSFNDTVASFDAEVASDIHNLEAFSAVY